MPKQVTLMRHAKSSWEDYSLSDYDRPLAPRGKKAAPRMGKYMLENKISPDVVLCSPAQRTKETLARVQTAFGGDFNICYDKMIYSAGMGHGLIELLHQLEDSYDHALIVGHNPAMQELALSLVNWIASRESEVQHFIRRKFSTGAIASMQFNSDNWKDVGLARGHLTHFMTPKLLG
ncbi:SixA phosphatase family protein [Sneathiella limimaris]|uniref:SixA phosphatase family protein n=1 Tax=Sneathiella limimaris TaxID=1964213 RepID=UPI00146E6744|nr:histidine phosphatase family protein [Sneathiella limimaris]